MVQERTILYENNEIRYLAGAEASEKSQSADS